MSHTSIAAEGGRIWPEGPDAGPCDGICGPEDVHAWVDRLRAEVNAGDVALSSLSSGGQWIGPAAQSLASEIDTWQDGARDETDDAGAVGDGFLSVIGGLATSIEEGVALNSRARAMVFEAGQAPKPVLTAGEPAPGVVILIILGVASLAVAIYSESRKE